MSCKNEQVKYRFLKNTEYFIKKASTIHDGRYDYSKTIYNGVREKLIIICPVHGEFEQKPIDHYDGSGCPECGKEVAKEKIKQTKIRNGLFTPDDERSQFEIYRKSVTSITDKNWREYREFIDPNDVGRSNEFHLDHIYSVFEGFKNNIDPETISHPANLRIICATENISKGTDSHITLDQLNNYIALFEEKTCQQ